MTHAVTISAPFSAAAAAPVAPGEVQGAVRTLLRLEALAMLAGSLVAFGALGGSWGWFAALFLVPDVSLLGYLAGPRVGAVVYNAAHSYVGPAILAAIGVLAATPTALLAVAIWTAHIGFDRALGYGLKYATAFRATHLGVVGHQR
jgi:hypothetical protein